MRRYLNPYAPPPRRAAANLDLSAKIETNTGWLDLQDGLTYELEASSLAERAVTYRRGEATSPFIEGTFVTSAVRENVSETLAVWVRGDSRAVIDQHVTKLTDALQQLAYRVMIRIDDSARYWTCMPADYTISTIREYLHGDLALVKATIPRLPAEEVVFASGDEV